MCSKDKSGITYKCIPQASKTIATLEGCGNNLEHILYKLIVNNSRYLYYMGVDPVEGDNRLLTKNVYRGVAKCNTNEGDVYNEEEGKLQAYKKVMAKYHKNMDHDLCVFLDDVRNLAAGVEHYLDKKGVDYSKVSSVEEIKNIRFKVND